MPLDRIGNFETWRWYTSAILKIYNYRIPTSNIHCTVGAERPHGFDMNKNFIFFPFKYSCLACVLDMPWFAGLVMCHSKLRGPSPSSLVPHSSREEVLHRLHLDIALRVQIMVMVIQFEMLKIGWMNGVYLLAVSSE